MALKARRGRYPPPLKDWPVISTLLSLMAVGLLLIYWGTLKLWSGRDRE